VDTQSGELYQELNLRISGISPMTNASALVPTPICRSSLPSARVLDLDYEVDIDEINERWSHEAPSTVSQLILKETADDVELLTAVPRTGVYTIAPDGSADFRRHAYDWHGIIDESEAFYLRILTPGDFRYKGADLGALVTRGRLQADDNTLERRCAQWITGIRGHFALRQSPVATDSASPGVLQDGLTLYRRFLGRSP
jgi:hypothetical protein